MKSSVTFANFGDHLASSRLRAKIPQDEVRKLGYTRGLDVVVYGKHFVTFDQIKHFKKKVFDCCDDHFGDQFASYYREHIAKADLITCNSETMREIIKRETGRDSFVVPDPYESEEQPAGRGEGLYWFGHKSNLRTIDPYADLVIKKLTGNEWSRERQLEELKACALVVLPTDDRIAKSANRLIEAARNGRFVIAGPLPAHDEFKPYMWIGDIREGVKWATDHPAECEERIKSCQRYFREKYSPESIGKQWAEVLEKIK